MQKGEIQTIYANDKKDDLNTFQTCFIMCNNGLFPLLDTCKRHGVFWICTSHVCIYVREDDIKTHIHEEHCAHSNALHLLPYLFYDYLI